MSQLAAPAELVPVDVAGDLFPIKSQIGFLLLVWLVDLRLRRLLSRLYKSISSALVCASYVGPSSIATACAS